MASAAATLGATLASAVATKLLRMPWATPKWSRVRTPSASTWTREASSPGARGGGSKARRTAHARALSPKFRNDTELKLGAEVRSERLRQRSEEADQDQKPDDLVRGKARGRKRSGRHLSARISL